MNTKSLYSILAIIVIALVAGAVYMQSSKKTSEQAEIRSEVMTNQESAPSDNKNSENPTDSTPAVPTTEGQYSGESDVTDVDVAVHEISFNGVAYTPANIEIKNGDIVIFKNEGEKKFWPASAMHPDHLIYPEFDPKKGIEAGGTWQFKFTKVGKWGFHDHLTPTAYGSITVKE